MRGVLGWLGTLRLVSTRRFRRACDRALAVAVVGKGALDERRAKSRRVSRVGITFALREIIVAALNAGSARLAGISAALQVRL